MAVEAKRGCGYRKVGGLYLVASGLGSPCCKMPLELTICSCCGAGIKQTRGWTWIDAGKMFGAGGCSGDALTKSTCPVVNPALMGRVGLLWIGEKFYKRPIDFANEAAAQGISRRLSAIPRDFKAGETWVLFAHPKAIQKPRVVREEDGALRIYRPDGEREGDYAWAPTDRTLAEGKAAALDLEEPCHVAGVIRIAKPAGFEKIVKASEYAQALADGADFGSQPKETRKKTALLEQFDKDAARGVRWIPVPDDDKDHAGTVYDKETEDA